MVERREAEDRRASSPHPASARTPPHEPPARDAPHPAPFPLFERDAELAAIEQTLDSAAERSGQLLIFQGPAGIGKTALLERATARARERGFLRANARGSALERSFPYGLARQLLEPPLRAASDAQRAALLEGAAALSAPAVLDLDTQLAPAASDAFGMVHGLYWLVANLAAEQPLALVLDDLHWCDAPTLGWLAYLARRLDGLAVSAIVSIRSGESGIDLRVEGELLRGPNVRVLEPAALSDASIARVLADGFGSAPAEQLVRACQTATGGNPFYVHELSAALLSSGSPPSAQASALVLETGIQAIARSTLTRLGRISDDAIALARAIAVLDGDTTFPRAAALAELDERRALHALDALIGTQLVQAGQKLSFTHPIVRSAIYDELAPGERSIAHDRAASLLAAEGAPVEAAAAHALLTSPTGSPQTIATLREAAAHALAVGAPENAAAYLARAAEEGCGRELRARLLLDLALAEKLARSPAALSSLEEAQRLAVEPRARATAMLEQCDLLTYSGEWERAVAVADAAAHELHESESPLALQALTLGAVLSAYDPRLVDRFDARLPELLAVVRRGAPGSGPLALLLAGVLSHRGEPPDSVRALVESGWEEGRCLERHSIVDTFSQAIGALVAIEDFERATQLAEAVEQVGQERGSVLYFLLARANVALIETRRGNLAAAEDDMRLVIERALELGMPFGVFAVLSYCCDVLLERPETADLAALALGLEPGPLAEVMAGAMLIATRARLHYAAGDRARAVEELRSADAIAAALRFEHPNGMLPGRAPLALMLPDEDRAQALALARGELETAQRLESRIGAGVALRTLGMLSGGVDGIAMLEQAVELLAASAARLEHARARVELGAALRRAGSRARARDPLREGLDLAQRCGAVRLIEQARTELAATGARPRRAQLSGRDSLTPSELRVATMAAEGCTSREIAQALFVTTKTVDAHLGHVYTKLGIGSRRMLAQALTADAAVS